jgi:hypothetical protein
MKSLMLLLVTITVTFFAAVGTIAAEDQVLVGETRPAPSAEGRIPPSWGPGAESFSCDLKSRTCTCIGSYNCQVLESSGRCSGPVSRHMDANTQIVAGSCYMGK